MPPSITSEAQSKQRVQETDPGKFTIAFEDWRDGLVWAAHLKQVLAVAEYPSDLMDLPEMAPVKAPDGSMLRRGIQPKVRTRARRKRSA